MRWTDLGPNYVSFFCAAGPHMGQKGTIFHGGSPAPPAACWLLLSSSFSSALQAQNGSLRPGPAQEVEERGVLVAVAEDPRAAVAAIEDVVTHPPDTGSRGSWHALTLARGPPAVKQKAECPLFSRDDPRPGLSRRGC